MSTPGFDNNLSHSLGSLLAFNDTAPNGVNYYPTDGEDIEPPRAPGGSRRRAQELLT